MKTTLTIILCFFIGTSFGQIKAIKLDKNKIPANIVFKGKMVYGTQWKDNLGLNYFVASENSTGVRIKGGELPDATLFAYHYVLRNDSTKLLWRVYDYNDACDLDLNFYFIDKAFAITDLDNNGISEVWMMYKNSCHGDVSPIPTKIIMYEGDTKYALRGESKVKYSQTEFEGGTFTLDNNFKKGKTIFRIYAEKLWAKNINETWER